MRRVVVFTEGQGELIFVRYLLIQAIGYDHLSFECLGLRADRLFPVPYKYCSPNASLHYLLVNVGNDETVLSTVAERQENLISKGYDVVIGLRDMYSKAYRKRSRCIDDAVTDSFIRAQEVIIQQMSNHDRVHVFFAIMELESWLLSMYRLIERIHPSLSCAYIESRLGFNLSLVNPEAEFFHPAVEFGAILELADMRYKKSEDQMESILSKMIPTDINDALEECRRSRSFAAFFSEVVAPGQSDEQ